MMGYIIKKDISNQYTIWSVGESGSRQDVIQDGIKTKSRALKIIDKLYLEKVNY